MKKIFHSQGFAEYAKISSQICTICKNMQKMSKKYARNKHLMQKISKE